MIKKFGEYINEGVRDKMTPKSEGDIKKSFGKLKPLDKMYKAIEYGLLWLAKEAMEEGIDLDTKAGGGYTLRNKLPSEAVDGGNVDILEFLLDNGCHFEMPDDWFLVQAIEENHYEMAKYFADKGATLSEGEENNPLQIAVDNNNLKMLELVLDCEYDYFETDWFDDTLADDDVDPEIIKLMVKRIPQAKERVQRIYKKYKKVIDKIEKYV